MSTEFYNTQWQMPNEANKSKRANHSLQANTTSGERVDITNLPFSDSQSWTISFWVRPTTVTAGLLVFGGSQNYSGAGGFIFYLNNPGIIQFYSNPNRTYFSFQTGNNVVSVNTWHHVIFKYNYGVDYRIYVDGVLQAVSTGNGGSDLSYQWPTQNFGLFEKALPGYTGYRLRGALSDWCFFNYALSDTATTVGDTATGQIAQLYGNGSSLSNPMDLSPAPKVYYKLSDSVWDGSKYITANNAVQDYVFDFTSDYIETNGVGDVLGNGCTNFTIAFWFNHDQTPSTSGLYEFDFSPTTAGSGQHGIRLLNNTRFEIIYKGTLNGAAHDGRSRYNMPSGLNTWTHLVVSFDGTNNTAIYVNGQPATLYQQYTATPDSVDFAGTSVDIGIYNTNNALYRYDGKMSNFQVFNSSLTATEAETLYNYGSPIQTLANIPQSSNLKAWYKLDASEIYNNTSTEWEVNDATATYNSSSFVKPLSNQNTQFIQVNNFAGLTGASAGSWSFWYNTQDFNNLTINGGWFNGGQARWIGPYGTPHTGYTNTGEFNIYTSDGTQRTSLAASYGRRIFIDAPAGGQLNKWAHFVGTYDGSNLRVYMNGEQVGTGTGVTEFAATGTLTTTTIRFGGAYSYNSAYDAKFSNGSVWNKTLTLAEIVEIYNNGKPKSLSSHSAVSNLVSWWKLDNLTTGLVDSIGSYNATLVGSNSEVSPGSVSTLNGESSGMSQSNLVQSNLQTVAPYSKYAMNFNSAALDKIDTPTKIFNDATSYTASIWAKGWSTSTLSVLMGHYDGGNTGPFILTARHSTNTNGFTAWISIGNTFYTSNNDIGFSDNTKWLNLVTTWDGSNIILYVNGIAGEVTPASGTITNTTLYNFIIGAYPPNIPYNSYNGQLSNCSVWNTALSAAQVREIYNEGLPSDLNSHSAYSNLISWWKLSEGVSYDGTSLIAQDYKGNNHGTSSSSMDQTNIVNGVGTSLNGASAGFTAPSTTVTNIVSDAPYSDKNAVSVNMQSAKSGSGIDTSTPQAT